MPARGELVTKRKKKELGCEVLRLAGCAGALVSPRPISADARSNEDHALISRSGGFNR